MTVEPRAGTMSWNFSLWLGSVEERGIFEARDGSVGEDLKDEQPFLQVTFGVRTLADNAEIQGTDMSES